jgi:tetratricopeptide (TPR) repeat protein
MRPMKWRVAPLLPVVCGLAGIALLSAQPHPPLTKGELLKLAKVEVRTAREACKVDVDSAPAGKTNAQGELTLDAVPPGDHYVHVQCGDELGKAYFISPQPGATAEVRHEPGAAAQNARPVSGPEIAEIKIQLREHIQDAARLRARGRIEEAIAHLRDAFRLDPDNSDLHREMGITFLLAREWKRARVEMLEAIRNDPDDAEAHNGLGYALEKTGDIAGALKEYRTASRLEPTDSSYRRRYIDALAKLSALQATKKK